MPTVKIFVSTFDKDVKFRNDVFVPIQVGKKDAGINFGYLSDDTGDNISHLNKYFSEQTGVYWVWKNFSPHPDYIGFCHYRKLPYFVDSSETPLYKMSAEDYIESGSMDKDRILKTIDGIDVVMCYPLTYNCSLRKKYEEIHIKEDLDILQETVYKLYPEYKDDFEMVINEVPGCLLPYNIYIMKWELFDKWCNFSFSIWKEMLPKVKFDKHTCYQSRVFGYLAERLVNVFITHEFKPVRLVPCAFIDEFFKKGKSN